jgi:MFS family permease
MWVTQMKGEWGRGWPVVLGAIGGMMTVAAPSSITGLVMEPLQENFGWSRAQITANILIVALCALVCAPFAGSLINRYGARPIALISFISTAVGFVGIGLSGPSIWSWFAAWVGYGVLTIALGPIVWTSALSTLFDKHRGLALSIALSGSGFAFAVWPLLLTPLLANHSWRLAYLLLAAISILVMLPLNVLALRVLKQAAGDTHHGAATQRSVLWGPTLGQALRHFRFWRLTLALMLAAAVNGSLMIHFFPILSELRFSPQEAAFITALMGPAMIVGRIATGWLMDRLFAPFIAAVMLVLPSITLFLLMQTPTIGRMILGSLVLGVSTGAITCTAAYLAGRYFGLRDYASIFGVIIGIFGVSFGTVPVLTGHYYDVTGTYLPLLPWLFAGTVPIGLLLATLGRYPDPHAVAEPATSSGADMPSADDKETRG